MFNDYVVLTGLAVILFLTLMLPFSIKKVEEELEIFLFIMGISAVTVSNQWSFHLIHEALREPIMISSAVLLVGFIFKAVRKYMKGWMNHLISRFGIRTTIFIIALFLGLGSSILTAIISALILSEVMSILKRAAFHDNGRKTQGRAVSCRIFFPDEKRWHLDCSGSDSVFFYGIYKR